LKMAATELQLQEGAQTVLQGIEGLQPISVVVNDWSILDRPMVDAPFVLIVNADDFNSTQVTVTATTGYTLRLWLIVALANADWKAAYDEFRDYRQQIIDKFNEEGTNRSLGGLDGVNVTRIFSISDIGYIYPPNVDPDNQPDTIPDYVAQFIGLEIEQY